ncbi:1-phosphatidylinositol-5-phosphate 4-kinase [Sarotherodon galilaeus]
MTRPVPRRHAFDPADSDLFEWQEAALSLWAEKLREKQRLFAEREHVFEGTRLALGGPRRHRVLPPAASPAPEHPPRRVGVSRCASAAPSLAALLLADTPPASCTGPSASLRHSGSASHLGSTEAPAPEARLCTPPALSSWRERRARRHRTSHSELQHPVVSETDFFLSSHFKPETAHYPPNQKTVCCDDILDYPINTHHSASKETVPPSQATAKDIIPATPNNFSHSITISSPITQPFFASTVAQIQPSPSPVSPSQVKAARAQPVPVPAPRMRAAVTQSTSTPVPVSRVGVTGVQPPPVPVPAPRLKAARPQPDLPRGSEEPASPPVSSPLHPPPDPAFHALALSQVRLAEVSPAQAPASLAQSVAQPLATPTTAPSSASPTSVHPLASPLQSVPSPAVQLPVQSVPSPAVQLPLQPVHSPAVQPPLQPVHSPAVQPPVQSVQPAPAQSVQPAPAQSVQPAPACSSPPVPCSSVSSCPPVLYSSVSSCPPVSSSPVFSCSPVACPP